MGGVDTCFGLLFLKRVNVVEDLTIKIAKTPPKQVEDMGNPFITLVPVDKPGTNTTKKDPVANPKIDPKVEPKKDKPKPLFPKSSRLADPYRSSFGLFAIGDRARPERPLPAALTLAIAPARVQNQRMM
jgi:hypothetical protein